MPAIVGTAGHVDHGKTALIRALTGVDTDRLPEEKARGISIELGFAPLLLPSGRRVGVVDVPGHERFVHHMVAGAAGMDLVILVVAADEGVMPQTREHLDILTLLGLKRGVVALTKADLVEDDWLALVEEDVRKAVAGTFLEDAPLVPVSSVTGEGLPELLQEVDRLLAELPERDTAGPVRLPVDRVFTVPGFGTVVTGTLGGGTVRAGETVEILPGGALARVRQVEVHGEKVEEARAGQRVALNLAGVDRSRIRRGQVVCAPGAFSATAQLAGRLLLLPAASPLVSGARVRFHLGTAEVMGRVILLDREKLEPGQDGLARVRLEEEVVAARGDRFIVRSWSPPRTWGGGVVLAPHSAHRRYAGRHLAALAELETGDPAAEVLAGLGGKEPLRTTEQLAASLRLPPPAVKDTLERLRAEGRVAKIEGGGGEAEWWVSAERLRLLEGKARGVLQDYHAAHPARWGIPREELRQRLGVGEGRAFAALVERWERQGLVETGLPGRPTETEKVRIAGFRPAASGPGARGRSLALEKLAQARFSPPGVSELVEEMVRAGIRREDALDLLEALGEEGELVKVSPDWYLSAAAYREAEALVREFLARHGSMTAAQFRDLLGTTRKYAIPLLERLDQDKVTRRLGEIRVLYTSRGES